MNRNIEVGCLVMVVNASVHEEMIGKVLTVIERTEDKDHFFNKPVWRLDAPIPNLACEDWLIRIDNHDASADETERNMELTQ